MIQFQEPEHDYLLCFPTFKKLIRYPYTCCTIEQQVLQMTDYLTNPRVARWLASLQIPSHSLF